ncbi:MAG TPA: hypothetical protein VG326_18065 [Tepidisphaeraceae bacterium]|jgi:hypothetical protein|nr:hypothetical protein [Tepidisphaeraceae bacterium]
MRRWLWAFWATAAGLSVGLDHANAACDLLDATPTPTCRGAGLPSDIDGATAPEIPLELKSRLAGADDPAALDRPNTPRNFLDLKSPTAQPKARGDAPAAISDSLVPPVWLALVDEPQDVYPEIMPQRTQENLNGGGVNFGLDVDWLSDYVYRGVDQNTPGRRPENSLQFTAQAKFDLGKLPHPIIGLFVNVYNSDPVSRFEEVRPFFGAEWTLKPITITAGYISYIYPNRRNVDTQEVFANIALDDSRLFRTAAPIFSPYIYGAYDVDLYKGFYIETGIRHDFVFEDFGFTFSPVGDIAYVANNAHYALVPTGRNWGLQHYDAGAIANLSLNHLFKMDHRHGEWSVNGYLYYTGRFDNHLRADNLIWGGVGLEFRY